MGFVKEFKDFAVKGNVVDMAIGIIIGGAFGKIVSSLVEDVMMPPLGMLTSGLDFTRQKVVIQKEVIDAAGAISQPEVAIRYGNFIQVSINFLLVAMAVFFLVKVINRLRAAEEKAAEVTPPAPPAPPEPTTQEKLLMEIRDALRK
ncbi:large conductance mechanosensitive channel [Flexibacter flexilis DSM 6793]|uniref:Large-conductance mechanosensitive channel n=1 Tax=Flexibacter flexilis DSM 6793 TaxID=927664 RepID=A0A1I1JZT6_9BACT|nr:large-conductance mechanosensitive channel protein MscL [Flexibacter flexilis]SFC54217.1 large conductance mechanosensitive channel [Flexibacter flexilis DSM 6793]